MFSFGRFLHYLNETPYQLGVHVALRLFEHRQLAFLEEERRHHRQNGNRAVRRPRHGQIALAGRAPFGQLGEQRVVGERIHAHAVHERQEVRNQVDEPPPILGAPKNFLQDYRQIAAVAVQFFHPGDWDGFFRLLGVEVVDTRAFERPIEFHVDHSQERRFKH